MNYSCQEFAGKFEEHGYVNKHFIAGMNSEVLINILLKADSILVPCSSQLFSDQYFICPCTFFANTPPPQTFDCWSCCS